MQHLGEEYFPLIVNPELIGCDSYPYRPEWEVTAKDVAALIEKEAVSENGHGKGRMILDIRKREDYRKMRLPHSNSINIDIGHRGQPNPFRDAPTLARQWTRLNEILGPQNKNLGSIHPGLGDKERIEVICMCYDGHTAKIATRWVNRTDLICTR
jgi:rhodanese-related sulfurtransferase